MVLVTTCQRTLTNLRISLTAC